MSKVTTITGVENSPEINPTKLPTNGSSLNLQHSSLTGNSLGDYISRPNSFSWSIIPWTQQKLENVIGTLVKAFAPSEVKELAKGGRSNSYIETTSCIDRLNEAFTPMGWSFTTSDPIWQPVGEGSNSRQIAVKATITVITPWGNIIKEGWGARTVMSIGDGAKMEFGDDVKSASSDALKKAATLLGIYNYGYRKGPNPATQEVSDLAKELSALFLETGMNSDQFREFAGGICRKTILGVGDLSLTQAQAVKMALETLPKKALATQKA